MYHRSKSDYLTSNRVNLFAPKCNRCIFQIQTKTAEMGSTNSDWSLQMPFLLPEAHCVFEMVLFVCLLISMKDLLRYRDAT